MNVDLDDARTRVEVVATRLPSHVAVGGWAAALLHELVARRADDQLLVFDGRLPEMDVAARVSQPVLVCGQRRARLRPVPGVRLFRSDLPADELTEVLGIRVTTPARTAFDLARLWPTTPAVVALDRLANLGLVQVSDVADLIRTRAGWHGADQARRAVTLADGDSASPRESMIRLLWVAAGLPRPTCNTDVLSLDGVFLGRPDLLDEGSGLAAEYDGADHAPGSRRHRDAVRQERLEDAGLVVVRANEPDVATESGRRSWQARLRQAHARARRSPRPRRWRAIPRRRPT